MFGNVCVEIFKILPGVSVRVKPFPSDQKLPHTMVVSPGTESVYQVVPIVIVCDLVAESDGDIEMSIGVETDTLNVYRSYRTSDEVFGVHQMRRGDCNDSVRPRPLWGGFGRTARRFARDQDVIADAKVGQRCTTLHVSVKALAFASVMDLLMQ